MLSGRLLFFEKKKKRKISLNVHSLSLLVIRCTIRCHSLSFVVTHCTTRCHSLSLVVPLVTRCTTRVSFYKRSQKNETPKLDHSVTNSYLEGMNILEEQLNRKEALIKELIETKRNLATNSLK